MNQYTDYTRLEQLHREATFHRTVEIVRASDRTDWQSAQRQLQAIAARWTWGAPQAKRRSARGQR